jgi:hypothetical protein
MMMLLSGLALLSTLTELWLENHVQEPLQFIPWALCLIGLGALVPALLRPGEASLRALRVAMAIVAIGGVVGIGVHLTENLGFQHEIHPSAPVTNFLLDALKGAAPLLAPGALTFAALLGLGATYYHPALQRRD